MKYINKNIKNEPETLRIYRETTPNASYNGFVDTDKLLKNALLEEQGYICAYCMKRISLDLNEYIKPKIEVEHYKSQENFPEEDLNYKNMLGVCNGNSGGLKHCDKSRDYIKNGKTHSLELKRLNPILKKNSEDLITYTPHAEVISKSNNSDIEDDINKILNLNNEELIQYRKYALDKARKQFKENYPKKQNKTWNIKMFNKEIEKYKTMQDGKYQPFCQFIIWHFEQLKKRKKYQ